MKQEEIFAEMVKNKRNYFLVIFRFLEKTQNEKNMKNSERKINFERKFGSFV